MKTFDIFLETIQSPLGLHVSQFVDKPLTYAMHYHPEMELVYCSSGCLHVHLDKYTYALPAGGFAVITPLAVHSFSCEEKCTSTFVHIPESLYLQVEKANVLNAPHTGYLFNNHQELNDLLMTVYDYISHNDGQIASYYSMILLTLCVRHIQSLSYDVRSCESNNHPLLRQVLSYIQKHYKESVTLKHLCKEFGLGKSAMSRMINIELQTSLPELINKYRMLEASRLLIQTQMPITEISEEIGYGSPCNFNRNFQRHFGIAPREYRKQQL